MAHVVDRHRAQRGGDPLPGGEQHVQLAPVRIRRDLLREPEEIVGTALYLADAITGDAAFPTLDAW